LALAVVRRIASSRARFIDWLASEFAHRLRRAEQHGAIKNPNRSPIQCAERLRSPAILQPSRKLDGDDARNSVIETARALYTVVKNSFPLTF
jgi:hypothetical protein